MNILSLETATFFGGVAFLSDDARESLGPFASRESSRQVLAAADTLLERHACPLADLDVVAVSTGPGLFTGVRVGLAIAKSLAWAGKEGSSPALVAVPTLEAVAYLAVTGAETGAQPGEYVVAVTDARRGEVYAALFCVEQHEGLALKPVSEDIVVRPDRMAERLLDTPGAEALEGASVWMVGDGMDRYGDELLGSWKDRARVFPHEEGSLALRVADLGRARFELGMAEPAESVMPHYVRRPDARLPVGQYLKPQES